MGNFYVNFTILGPDQKAIAASLRTAKRKAFISPTLNGLTVFYDEDSDTQDDTIIQSLGKRISKDLAAPVLAICNHDDDILAYWLFDAGKLVDEYNSCPGYFDDGEPTPSGGDTEKLCAAFKVPTKAKQVNKILRNEDDYVFALERHEALALLLKHPWPYVCMGYNYIKEGSLAEGVSPKDLLEIK